MPLRAPWVADDSLVLVVASCRGGYEQARRFGLYHCQNRRSIRAARYIAFYAGGRIDTVAEIDGPPEDDVVIAERSELGELARAMPETNGDPWEPHSLIRLRNIRSVGPIVNDMVGKSGKRVAWTQSQSYTRIDTLRAARRTSELTRA